MANFIWHLWASCSCDRQWDYCGTLQSMDTQLHQQIAPDMWAETTKLVSCVTSQKTLHAVGQESMAQVLPSPVYSTALEEESSSGPASLTSVY